MCIRCELWLESCRHTAINSLRARFTKDWKAACGVKPGKETFNSILFSCIAQADALGKHNWPRLLASDYDILQDIEHELCFVWPCKKAYPRDKNELDDAIAEYEAAAQMLLAQHWPQHAPTHSYEGVGSCAQRYQMFRAASFKKLLPLLQEKVQCIRDLFARACEEMGNEFDAQEEDIRFQCHSSVLVDLVPDLKHLRTGQTQHRIRIDMHDKLKKRYLVSGASHPFGFAASLWFLLHRYHALMGPSGEGGNWHLSTPRVAMKQLHQEFDEPGGFFSHSFVPGGHFEVGPPYNGTVMNMVADKMQQVLQQAEVQGTPVAFVCVFPNWTDHVGIQNLKTSSFLKAHRVLKKHEHSYRRDLDPSTTFFTSRSDKRIPNECEPATTCHK